MTHTLNNSFFENNLAILNGGAVKWTGRRTVYNNITFKSNSALYGFNEASYPINIMLKVKTKSEDLDDPGEIIYSSYNTSDLMTLYNLVSGGEFKYVLEFHVVDINNVTVNTLEGGSFLYIYIYFCLTN
jgi:hypothetical protein